MNIVLVDTDTLSSLMRRQPSVMRRAGEYLTEHHRLTFSIITQYEILRGLKAKRASKQEKAFTALCRSSHVEPLSDAVVARAAGIYAELHRQRSLIGDADILIAATAMEKDAALVSNNTKHFSRVAGLRLDNWVAS